MARPPRKLQEAQHVSRSYLKALFDFSFSRYITIQMLPVVYGLMILAITLLILQRVVEAWLISEIRGGVYLALAPFAFIVMVSICRALLEFFIVVFRIAEDMEELAGMRESVDKISGLTDLSSLTRRIPFMNMLRQSLRRPDADDTDDS